MTENTELRDIIRSVLQERFGDVVIDSIKIERDVDEDGDPILRVEVVFDGTNSQLDPGRASSVLRHMRPKLAEISEFSFPVISYIAKADMGERRPATN